MRISELLQELKTLAINNDISEPYIVGGLPRDRAFGELKEIKDIDITTGDDKSLKLATLSAEKWPEANFRIYGDKHSSLDFNNIRLDFSNNFNLPGITTYLKENGIDNPSELEKEIYSRDFTINTLLQPMDLKEAPKDTTGYAFKDIENKILRTPVDPNLTIGYDTRRILRGLKLSLKYDLKISKDLQEAFIKYRGGISDLPLNQVKKQVNQMLSFDSKKAIDLLSEYKLLPILPLSKMMGLELAKNHMVQFLLEGDKWENHS